MKKLSDEACKFFVSRLWTSPKSAQGYDAAEYLYSDMA